MGTALSLLGLPKLYQKLIDFHQSIAGNWFIYFNILFKFYLKKFKPKARFESYDCDADDDPYAVGLLPPQHEWSYECPQKNRSENFMIYGTNSWGQYLIVQIKWRPKSGNKVFASYRLIFKDENEVIYEAKESELLAIDANDKLRQYKFAGLNLQVLSPYRKLRIGFRGLLRRKDTNELVYSRFALFWSALTNIFDLQNDFNEQYVAKQLSCLTTSEVRTEDRHEQWGQLTGTVQLGSDASKEVFLWGNKSKQLFGNEYIRKVTRIYGFDAKSFAFHVGAVRGLSDNYRLPYGYVTLGSGTVYPMSGITASFGELESMATKGSDSVKFTLEIKQQNREFDIEIGNLIDSYEDLVVYELKLNGHIGKCVVINDLTERIVDPLAEVVEPEKANDLVLTIDDINSKNVGLSGGKGCSLAVLSQMARSSAARFSVPKGLIVTTNAYNTLVENCGVISDGIDKLERVAWSEDRRDLKKCCEEVSKEFAEQSLPDDIVEQLNNYLRNVFGNTFDSIRFAVRSSALTEDSSEMSSAGQMTTYLGVKGLEAISEAVMKCWSSQFEFIAVEYKRGYGQEINSPMAVVVQEMVDCDSAGVMFTCDPITGDERNVLITANYGIGESVVSAMAEPDTIRVGVTVEANSLLEKRHIRDIESIDIGSKQKSIVLSEDIAGGTVEKDVIDNKKCCLSEEQIRSLAEVGIEVHRHYGDARDIEWGFKDNRIVLLQSRPITNLDNWSEWEAMHDMDSGQQSESEYFSRANLGEVFPGASSHLCLSWLLAVWNSNGFRNWRKMFGLPKSEFSPFYNRGGGIVNNFYFFLLKTGTFPFVGDPKSTVSKSIQIGMFGHEFDGQEWDELMKDSTEKAPKTSLPLRLKIYLALGSIKYFLTPSFTLREAKNRLNHLVLFRNKLDFTAKDMFYSLLSDYHHLVSISYAHGKATLCSMMYNMFLLETLKKNNSNSMECYIDFAQLVSSVSQVVSAQVPKLLAQIAVHIEDKQKFQRMSDEKALKYLLYSETKASEKFKSFLLEYGHRGYKEFDPMSLQWGDNPVTVVRSIKAMLNADLNSTQNTRNKSLDEIIGSLKTKLSSKSKFLIKYLALPWCRTGVALREQGKHTITWAIHQYRKAFWRLATKMVSEGRIPNTELLFHMTVSEIQILLEDRDPTVIARARLRKKLHPIKEAFKFDETTIGPNMKPRNLSTSIEISEGSVRLRGTPVSTGKIKGRCCVAMSLEEAQQIQTGDILITYSTDIAWSPYFPMLSGLATEIGGLISHGSVIAREYGLPCVVGVEGATKTFTTGDIVVIDSELGEIYKCDCDR